MYALTRNAGKYETRDKRSEKLQKLEYDWLAPDSVNEMFHALQLMKKFSGQAWSKKNRKKLSDKEIFLKGEKLLEENDPSLEELEILAEGFENSRRKTELIKVGQSYQIFKELIVYYGISEIINFATEKNINSWQKLLQRLPLKAKRNDWMNVGGQLLPQASVDTLLKRIRSGKLESWDAVHEFYHKNSEVYKDQKLQHAIASMLEITKTPFSKFTKRIFKRFLEQALATREWMTKAIYESRAKDHHNEFRTMVYDNLQQMDKVIGKLDENEFINQQVEELKKLKIKIEELGKLYQL